MKKKLSFFLLYLAYISFAQVGIGNSTPRGALDINRPTTNTYGLVLPTNSSVTNIVNPRGGAIAPATTIYESSNDCIRHYRQSAWSNCLLTENGSLFNISKVEQASTFTGTYKSNVAMTTANTYVVGIKNESPTAVSITLSTFDLKLSGVEGISVASVAPATVTIQPGQTALATYRLTGTPTTCGTLTGTWNKMKLNHTATVDVLANPTYQCNLGSWNNTVAPEYRINGLIPGVSYTGTYTIPYTGSSESDCELQLPAETITQDGLTLTYTGGPVSPTGTITYTLSGTYTGPNNGAITFTTASGCQIYLGPCRSCKELINLFPGTPSGVYTFNLYKGVSTSSYIHNLYCDMTTNGGGWTLVSRNGSSSRFGQSGRNTISEPTDNGYIFRSILILIANAGTQVQLRSGSSPTNYAHRITSQPEGPAILALRSSDNTNAGSGTWHRSGVIQDFMNNTTISPTGSWSWAVSCQSTAAGWPRMFHACGNTNSVHWYMDVITENRTSSGDSWASTWIR